MFQGARIKLTAWYLLIIAAISIFFSIAIFTTVNRELERIERTQMIRQVEWGRIVPASALSPFDDINIPDVRFRIVFTLAVVDASIITLATLAGYFLAGRTLRPISDMVDNQNRFIADASHELRTPLTSLKSEIEVALRDKELEFKQSKELLASNLEEVNKLQNLSDNLIKLTQYHKANGTMVFKREFLKSIIAESMKKVSGVARVKKIKLEDKAKNFRLEVEKNTITELFVILLDNAVKYSPVGRKVTIESDKTDGHIAIRVCDNGMGIAKEDIPHVFERFYRGDKSRTSSGINGYGLGLSIAKEIVERHKGTISVQSTQGKGSVFTVRLPLKHSHSLI